MKKLACFAMACILCFSLLSGCGEQAKNEDTGEQVTLKMVLPFDAQSDLSLVQEKVNELLPEYLPNTQIELICDSAMGDKWSLWIAGKTSFDIAHSGFAMDLMTEIQKKSFIALDDLIDEYAPTIKKERDEMYQDVYLTGTYNGDLYAIPSVQSYVDKYKALNVTNNAVQYLDVDALIAATHGKPHIGDEVYQLIDDWLVRATAGVGHAEIYATYQWENCPAKVGYIFIGGNNSNLCYDPYEAEVKIIDWHETEEFKSYIKWMNKWYKEGYINKDVMAGGVPKIGEGYANIWLASNTENINFGESNIYETATTTYVKIQSQDMLINASYEVGALMTYMSIPATAKNPVRAIKFLEMLRTEKGSDILNMLAFGIEGTHYEKLSDTYIKAFDYEGQGTGSSKYGIPAWMWGNMLNGMYTIYPMKENIVAYAENYYSTTQPAIRKHDLYGFCFDLSDVNLQMTNIRSANLEFEKQLGFGVASDPEKTLATLTENLQKAGLQDVIEKMQAQADEYIKNNK